MDILGDKDMGKIITKYYEDSGEPELVRKAVTEARVKEQAQNSSNGTGKKSAVHTKLQKWG